VAVLVDVNLDVWGCAHGPRLTARLVGVSGLLTPARVRQSWFEAYPLPFAGGEAPIRTDSSPPPLLPGRTRQSALRASRGPSGKVERACGLPPAVAGRARHGLSKVSRAHAPRMLRRLHVVRREARLPEKRFPTPARGTDGSGRNAPPTGFLGLPCRTFGET
jgi:hypothetical protein